MSSVLKIKNIFGETSIPDLFYKQALGEHSIVAITGLDGVIIDVNDKFIEISGYSRDELIGATHSILNSNYHCKSFWKNMYEEIYSGNTFRGDIRNKKKNGSFYWVDTTIYPILDKYNKIKYFFSIRTDISKRIKNHEDQLEKQRCLAEFGDLLQTTTHDLKNLFTISKLSLEKYLLKNDQKILETLEESLEQSYFLLESLSNGEKLSSKQKVDDGRAFLDTFLNRYLLEFSEENIQFYLQNELTKFKWNLRKITLVRCLDNLLRNSIFALQEATEKKIILRVCGNAMNPSLYLEDSGEGISKSLIEEVFKRGVSTKKNKRNAGIGLYTTRKILNKEGFDISVSSKLGKTVFQIFKL